MGIDQISVLKLVGVEVLAKLIQMIFYAAPRDQPHLRVVIACSQSKHADYGEVTLQAEWPPHKDLP